MDTTLPKQPVGYKVLIKRSIAIYRKGLSHALILSLLLSITVFIPRLFSIMIGQELFLNVPLLSPHRLWLVGINLAALLFFVGILWRMHCAIIRKREPFIDDLRVGARKLLASLIVSILEGAIMFALAAIIFGLLIVFYNQQILFQNDVFGMTLTTLIFFGQLLLILYVSTLFFFTVPLIAIENNSVFVAIERSILLVWNHWWRVFSLQITPWIVYVLTLVIIRFVFRIDIHLYFVEHAQHKLWTTLLQILVFALYMPWVATLLLVQLHDLELRKKLAARAK